MVNFPRYFLDIMKNVDDIIISAKANLYDHLLQGRDPLKTDVGINIADLVLFNVGNEYYFIPIHLINTMSEYFGEININLFRRKDIEYQGFEFNCKDKVIKVVMDVQIQTYPKRNNNTPYSSLPLAV